MKRFTSTVKIAGTVLAAILLTGIILVSCKKEVNDPTAAKQVVKEACAGMVFPLLAGQTINAGELIVTNDETNLYVKYNITDAAQALKEVHLWVGTDPDLIPQNTPGNPLVGQFPYPALNLSNVLEYSFTIPLASIGIDPVTQCGSNLYVAAHGKAISNETMWSAGDLINYEGQGGGSWATYSTYSVCCNFSSK